MAAYEIAPELNLKKIVAEVKEFAKAMNEFANDLEQIEKKYADGIHQETVTEFADRCRECGARYGRLLNQKWIPVSERLPEKFRYVNCTCHSLIDDREDWVIETVYIPQPSNSPYSDWGNIPMLNDKQCEVIAWVYREIPKPYKAEGSGEE